MVRRSAPLCFAALLLPCLAVTVHAQESAADPPAHISVVDGTAVLERDGRADTAPASMPLLAGDRVRTENGRVEILYTDGSTLHLDTNTTVDFQSDEVVRLLEGRIRLNIAGNARSLMYRIDAPGAWVQIAQPGEYRVALLRGNRDVEVELAVLRGAAELVNEDGRTPLRAGERAFARPNEAPSYAYVFNSAEWDAFDRWSETRRDQRLALSAQYLPDEVRPYAGTFDRYGNWQYQPTYGYVWYPRVATGWRPYYYGRWASLRPYGWTWIGYDTWSWPTHHYGRWGFSAGIWFWIPGRHWAPAWVSWAYAPGYVSWCPLGWDNRPVVQFVNVNIYRGYDPWRAWTVVPQRRFGYVNVNSIAVGHVDPRGFRVRETGPAITGYAVPRSSAPIRMAGTRGGVAVPRGGATAPSPAAPGAYRASPQTQGQPSDARESFRRRGTSDGALTGPGLPAPSRAPREPSSAPARSGVAVPRGSASSPSGAAPYGDRAATPRSATPSYDRPDRRVVPRGSGGSSMTSPGAYGDRSIAPRSGSPSYDRPERRAVPRDAGDAAVGSSAPYRPAPRTGGASSTYSLPEYRSPRRSTESASPAPTNPPVHYGMPERQAVPRSPDPGSYRRPAGPPPEVYRGAPSMERPAPAGPPPGAYRGTPSMERPAPAGPPPGYRSAPEGGRPAPAGPPPSASPRSGDRPAEAAPPQGGGAAGGRAVRRPGGGR